MLFGLGSAARIRKAAPMTQAPPFIPAETVARALTPDALIDQMARALIAFSDGSAPQPLRSSTPLDGDGVMLSMPARFGDIAAVKVVTFCPGNADLGLHTHHAVIVALTADTGIPIAMIDGTLVTTLRTAAASAAAARGVVDQANRIAIIGAGVQGRAHIDAFRHLFPDAQIVVTSRTAANAQALAADTGAEFAETVDAATRDAQIVIACTSARAPVLFDHHIADGALVVSVGAPLPGWRELDGGLLAHGVMADSVAGCNAESGDLLATERQADVEMGAVLAGTASAPRGRVQIFMSGGLAVEDAAAAELILRAQGLLPG